MMMMKVVAVVVVVVVDEQCYSEVNKCPFLSVCNSETIT